MTEIKLPERIGDDYHMRDDKNNVEYSFSMNGANIYNFELFNKNKENRYILPNIDNHERSFISRVGGLRCLALEDNSLFNIPDNSTIVITSTKNIAILNAFLENNKINIILPRGKEIYYIRNYDEIFACTSTRELLIVTDKKDIESAFNSTKPKLFYEISKDIQNYDIGKNINVIRDKVYSPETQTIDDKLYIPDYDY